MGPLQEYPLYIHVNAAVDVTHKLWQSGKLCILCGSVWGFNMTSSSSVSGFSWSSAKDYLELIFGRAVL